MEVGSDGYSEVRKENKKNRSLRQCRRLCALGIDGYFGKYEYMSFMLDTRS